MLKRLIVVVAVIGALAVPVSAASGAAGGKNIVETAAGSKQFSDPRQPGQKGRPGRDAAPARRHVHGLRADQRRLRQGAEGDAEDAGGKQGDAETVSCSTTCFPAGCPASKVLKTQVGDHRRGRKGSVQRARQERLRERIENHQNRHRMQQRDHPRDQRGADPAGPRIAGRRSGGRGCPRQPGGATDGRPRQPGSGARGWSGAVRAVRGARRGTARDASRLGGDPGSAVGRRRMHAPAVAGTAEASRGDPGRLWSPREPCDGKVRHGSAPGARP